MQSFSTEKKQKTGKPSDPEQNDKEGEASASLLAVMMVTHGMDSSRTLGSFQDLYIPLACRFCLWLIAGLVAVHNCLSSEFDIKINLII